MALVGLHSCALLWAMSVATILPLGTPPEAENPVLSYAAPEECLFYASWATMATPNPASENRTERLLAEPELKEFAAAVEKTLVSSLTQQLQHLPPDQQKLVRLGLPITIRALLTRGATVYISKVNPAGEKITVDAGMLVHAADDAVTLNTFLKQALELVKIPSQEITLGTATFTRCEPPSPDFPNPITFGVVGPYFLLGIGDQATEKMLERLKAKKLPAWLTRLRQQLPVERRCNESYLNVPSLLNQFLPLAGPEVEKVAASLGSKGVGEYMSTTGLDQQGTIVRSVWGIQGAATGLLQLFEGEGIKDFQLHHVPSDATTAAAYSVPAAKIYDLVMNTLRDLDLGVKPETEQFFSDQFREQFGVGLREDFLPALGETWTMHLSPADGWFMGVTFSVSVANHAKLELMQTKILEQMTRQADARGIPRPRNYKIGSQTIHYASFPDAPFQPAWCLTNDRIYFALTPSTLKPLFSETMGSTPLFTKGEWQKRTQSADPILVVGHQDMQRSFEFTYGYVAMILPIVSQAMNQQTGMQGLPSLHFDPASLPSARSVHRHLLPSTTIIRRTKFGIETELRQTIPAPDFTVAAPVAIALILPAVQGTRGAANRIRGTNNLKQIGLACLNYHDANGGLPPAYIPDSTGKPGLSWRVAILPYVEQGALYEQFKLDEPWDSEHNKQLIPKMPKLYVDPQSRAPLGKTTYLGVAGKFGFFVPPRLNPNGMNWRPGQTIASIVDGTTNTAAVVIADDESAVIWTKPDDYVPDEKEPLKSIRFLNGNTEVLCADGSIRHVSKATAPQDWLNFMNRQDGNVINLK